LRDQLVLYTIQQVQVLRCRDTGFSLVFVDVT
jgi:hypothetical protein